jgi:hypothetical protein
MRAYYVIKFAEENRFVSKYNRLIFFEIGNVLTFESENEALEHIKKWNGHYIIEKIYSKN